MKEETVFRSEEVLSREEIASFLGEISRKLEANEALKLKSGGQETQLQVPKKAEFEVKVEEEGDETSLELEIEWKPGADSKELTLE